MRSLRSLLRWSVVASGFFLGPIGPARAAVVWTATFESGDLSEWMPGINGKKGERVNVQVLGERVYRGKLAGKITVHPDDTFTFNQNRVDIQHPSRLTDEGKDSWLSGHYMMPEDAKVRNQIGFYESNVSFQNVMDFWVEPKAGGGTTINFGVGFLGENKLWTADFTPGVWHQLAIHVHWSTDPQKGSVDVWFDGAPVVTGHHAKTKADANSLFFQTGLHRRDVAPVTDVIFLDDFIEADSEAEAKIAAPSEAAAGGSAGSSAAGGGAGSAGSAGSGGGMSQGGGASPAGGVATGGGGSGGGPSSTAGASSSAGGGTGGVASRTAPTEEPGCGVSPTRGGLPAALLMGLLLVASRLRHRARSSAQ